MKGTSTMGSLKALILASVALTGLATVGKAADLLPPPPMVEPMAPAPVDFGGWYLRGDVGVGISSLSQQASTFAPGYNTGNPQFTNASLDDAMIIGLGAGYQFNNWFRADITGEYRSSAHYTSREMYSGSTCTATIGNCSDGYSASISSAVFLANGYVDVGTWNGFTPFVGAGVGFADHYIRNLTDTSLAPIGGWGYAQNSSSMNFAWAAMAGISYAVAPNLKLEASYRYLDMGRPSSGQIVCPNSPQCPYEVQKYHIASNDIRIGLRWMFNDMPPPPPQVQMPLVRKY